MKHSIGFNVTLTTDATVATFSIRARVLLIKTNRQIIQKNSERD